MVYVSAIGIEMKILFLKFFLIMVEDLKIKKKIVMDSPTFSCAAFAWQKKDCPSYFRLTIDELRFFIF